MTITVASIIAFAFAMFVLAVTPGPAFFSVTARTISSGPLAGVGVTVGIVVADLIYFSLALVGMSALTQALGDAFFVIKIVAAIYLVYLGIKMWGSKVMDETLTGSKTSSSFISYFIEGLAVNLTNPKAIIFFAALLPTFVDLTILTFIDSMILMGVVVFIGGGTDLVYVLLASRVRNKLKTPKAQIILNRVAGVTLIGVGAGVAAR